MEPIKKNKILILDDQPEIREIISEILDINFDGFEFDEAGNLLTANTLVNANEYDLLLVDIYLKNDESGLDFISYVKNERNPNMETPIFVITGYADTVKPLLKNIENVKLFSKVEGIEKLTSNVRDVLNIPMTDKDVVISSIEVLDIKEPGNTED